MKTPALLHKLGTITLVLPFLCSLSTVAIHDFLLALHQMMYIVSPDDSYILVRASVASMRF